MLTPANNCIQYVLTYVGTNICMTKTHKSCYVANLINKNVG